MVENKKKIIYCITKGNWGGAQRYVYDLVTNLPKENYESLVVLGSTGILTLKLKEVGVKIKILETSREIRIFKDFLILLKLIKIFYKEKPDIVHLNSSKMGILGVLAGKITRVPKVIFTGHGWAFNEDRGSFQKKIIYFIHLLTVLFADKTIMVSEETKRQIIRDNKLEKKTIVIKNGIEKINFLDKDSARNEIIKKLPVEIDFTNKIWLGTISELHKNKGLKYMIEALHIFETESDDSKMLPMLIIIGDGEKKEALQKRIDRYGLNKNIFLVGQINEAAKYLKAFDVFTLTSITEALPYAILEAGQAGLPIIASGVGGIPEIIDDMTSGVLVRPKEPKEIERALTFFLKNTDKTRLIGEKIRERIESNFNIKKMIQQTMYLY